jgi:hypothetical protein
MRIFTNFPHPVRKSATVYTSPLFLRRPKYSMVISAKLNTWMKTTPDTKET